MDLDPRVVPTSDERDVPRADYASGRNKFRTFAKVQSSRANIASGLYGFVEADTPFDINRVLLNGNSVSTGRQWRAGEDTNGFALIQRSLIVLTGSNFPRDFEGAG